MIYFVESARWARRKQNHARGGHYRIPNSGDLDVGAGDFSPNTKYLNNGWSDFNKDE